MVRHSEGKTHKKMVLSPRSQAHLTFKSTTDPIHEKVTAAEIRNTVMITQHNTALCLADHIATKKTSLTQKWPRTITVHEQKWHVF